jgi:hypothetical protein
MNFAVDWQMPIVLAVVGAAVAHLAYRVWLLASAREKPSCGGCGSCPAKATASGDGFVPLEQLGSRQNTA